MGVSHEALALEQRAIGRGGEPTLGAAFELLFEQWRRGDRDRELALHLMFLAWYLCAEPAYLTGMDDEVGTGLNRGSGLLGEILIEAHDELHRRAPLDPEFNYVVSKMASLFPWCCGPEQAEPWEQIAIERRQTYERLQPGGLTAEVFEERGFYGDYFAHMIRNES